LKTLTIREHGKSVWADRYQLKNENGEPLENSIEDSCGRIATFLSSKEKKKAYWKKRFLEVLTSMRFLPGGRIWANAGTGNNLLYNCWFLNVEDSRESIFGCLQEAMELMARGGGVGFNLSSLRPKGSPVKKVNGKASGPCSFLDIYNTAVGTISQGGSRRGAAIAILDISHPDIQKFINAKRDESRWNNFNVSVNVNNDFIKAIKNDEDWILKFGGEEYDKIKAKKLWDEIVDSMWSSGEPGIVNLELANYWSNTQPLGETLLGFNPCSEQILPDRGSCNLGSINLVEHVKDGHFDFDSFTETVSLAVRMLDNVIDLNEYPYEAHAEVGLSTRRIGLGIMGLANTLFLLKMKYASKDSMVFIEQMLKCLRDNSYLTSIDLAEEHGSFPLYDEKFLKSNYIKTLPKEVKDKIKEKGIRNACLLSQPPTGTTSQVAGVSSGHEPVFEFEFERKDRMGKVNLIDPIYAEWKKENPEGDLPSYFITAHDLSPKDHLDVHLLFTKYIDSSVSKTVNFPNKTSKKEISKFLLDALPNLKGITVYRDGSRWEQVLSKPDDKKEVHKIEVPDVATGVRYRRATGECGQIYLHINVDEEGRPIETFIDLGEAGGCVNCFLDGVGKLGSRALQHGVPLKEIAKAFRGIRCPKPRPYRDACFSCLDGVARMMETHLKEEIEMKSIGEEYCPACGSVELEKYSEDNESCVRCRKCGYRSCSEI